MAQAAGAFVAVDLHGDILLDVLYRRRFLLERRVLLARHLPVLLAGGVKIQVLPVYVESRYQPEGALRQALLTVAALHQEIAECDGAFQLVRARKDLGEILESKSMGVLLAFEGAEPLGRDVALIPLFYELGLRMMGLTWNRANLLAQGAAEDTGGGLSAVGRELVAEASRVGVILDVSHLNQRSFWDVLEISKGSVLASHSNASAVWSHPRNLSDDQISALAARGGLMGLNFVHRFVGPGDLLEGLVNHAEHLASLVGVSHIALGPDFIDYIKYMEPLEPTDQRLLGPSGLQWPDKDADASLLPSFYKALVARGFSEQDARLIMGGNAIRFLENSLP